MGGVLLRRLDPVVKRHTYLCGKYVKECREWSEGFIKKVLGKNWLQISATWGWGWGRGFISHIQLPLNDFLKYVKNVFELQPIENVILTGVVRGNIVFRGPHHSDIPRDCWEAMGIPKCEKTGGFCDQRGTHTHLLEEDFSTYLVNYGRKLAGVV